MNNEGVVMTYDEAVEQLQEGLRLADEARETRLYSAWKPWVGGWRRYTPSGDCVCVWDEEDGPELYGLPVTIVATAPGARMVIRLPSVDALKRIADELLVAAGYVLE